MKHFNDGAAAEGSALVAAIAEGLSSLERGEGVDGEEFFAELEREETLLEQSSAAGGDSSSVESFICRVLGGAPGRTDTR